MHVNRRLQDLVCINGPVSLLEIGEPRTGRVNNRGGYTRSFGVSNISVHWFTHTAESGTSTIEFRPRVHKPGPVPTREKSLEKRLQKIGVRVCRGRLI